jgi:hypothetical protein
MYPVAVIFGVVLLGGVLAILIPFPMGLVMGFVGMGMFSVAHVAGVRVKAALQLVGGLLMVVGFGTSAVNMYQILRGGACHVEWSGRASSRVCY